MWWVACGAGLLADGVCGSRGGVVDGCEESSVKKMALELDWSCIRFGCCNTMMREFRRGGVGLCSHSQADALVQ